MNDSIQGISNGQRVMNVSTLNGQVTMSGLNSVEVVVDLGGVKQRAVAVVNLGGVGCLLQYKEMPEAAEQYEENVVQYIGATDTDYTHCYFYECVKTGTIPSSISISQTKGTGLNVIAINENVWKEKISKSGTYKFEATSHDTWALNGVDVVPSAYGISYTPASATASVTDSSTDLETVTVNASTFYGKISEDGVYTFTADVVGQTYIDVLVGEEPAEGEPDERPVKRFFYEYGGGEYPDVLESWKAEDDTYCYTSTRTPESSDVVYSAPDTPYGNVKEVVYSETKWLFDGTQVTLSEYGIAYTGVASNEDSIEITFVAAAPHTGDEITVVYSAESDTYAWQQVNVQPTASE